MRVREEGVCVSVWGGGVCVRGRSVCECVWGRSVCEGGKSVCVRGKECV